MSAADQGAHGKAPPELSRYSPLSRLGAGPSGTVYRGAEVESGRLRPVAVKVIHPHLVRQEQRLEGFLAHLRRMEALRQPGVLPLRAWGRLSDGAPYLVSPLCPGYPLTDVLLDQGRLPLGRAVPLLLSVAEALARAHGEQVVHGNLSPENIWLDPGQDPLGPEQPLLLDFGMGLLHAPARFEEESRPPYYLAPEQIRGEPPGVSVDIYALGVIAYQLFAGRLPFSDPRPAEVLRMHLEDDPPPPEDAVELSMEAELFLYQVLSKDPHFRFTSMHQLIEDLRLLAEAEPGAEAQREPEPEADGQRQPQPEAEPQPEPEAELGDSGQRDAERPLRVDDAGIEGSRGDGDFEHEYEHEQGGEDAGIPWGLAGDDDYSEIEVSGELEPLIQVGDEPCHEPIASLVDSAEVSGLIVLPGGAARQRDPTSLHLVIVDAALGEVAPIPPPEAEPEPEAAPGEPKRPTTAELPVIDLPRRLSARGWLLVALVLAALGLTLWLSLR